MDGLGNRLTAVETLRLPDDTLQTTTIDYTYDPLYRLTEAYYDDDISADYTYEYDAVGNMVAYDEEIKISEEFVSVSRTFNAANQLVSSSDGSETTTYTYDSNGNLIETQALSSHTNSSYIFDQRNLLTSVTKQVGENPEQSIADYLYNGDGDRVQQVDYVSGTTISYTNDALGMTQVLLADDGTTTTANLFGLDLISQDDGSESRILLADGLGSVRTEMVDEVIETVTTYEPYGKLLVQTGSSGTVYGFTGEQEDAAAGLVYLRARYYNPSLKVFMSRDPFPGVPTMPATQHGYSYVHNNSPNYTDPSGNCIFGLDTFVCIAAAGGVVIGIVTGVTYDVMVNQAKGGIEKLLTGEVFQPTNYCDVDWVEVALTGGASGIIGGLAGGVFGAGVDIFSFPRRQQLPDDPGTWGPPRGPATGDAAEYEESVRQYLGGPADKNYYSPPGAPNGKAFDAWNPETNSYVDAKYTEGSYYGDEVNPSFESRRDELVRQDAFGEVEAAKPYSVEWWVSSEKGANWLQRFFERENIPIEVIPFQQP